MHGLFAWTGLSDYAALWVFYLLAALCLLIIFWLISRRWYPALKWPGRILLAAVMLAPVSVQGDRNERAPALVAAPFEWVFGVEEAAAPAISSLLYAVLVGLALSALVWIVLIFRGRRSAVPANEKPVSDVTSVDEKES